MTGGNPYSQPEYLAWKQLTPCLYDWFSNHSLSWPTLACRWGPKLEDSGWRKTHLAYISEQTDMTEMNTLEVVTCDVIKKRQANSEDFCDFNENAKSPAVKSQKTIFHPGEVNRIRELPHKPTVVMTHTDAPDVYVWDTEKQPDRAAQKGPSSLSSQSLSVPDLVLKGHTANAEYALSCCNAAPLVASGGQDAAVCVWNIADQEDGTLGGWGQTPGTNHLHMRRKLNGHTATVEDLCWRPGSTQLLASVGDDHRMLLWDLRSTQPYVRIDEAHGKDTDIHCVDWSPMRSDLIATGCANGVVKIWDLRKFNMSGHGNRDAALKVIKHHRKEVLRVEWSPLCTDVVATGSGDNLACVWKISQNNEQQSAAAAPGAPPPELLFQHAGHVGPVVDFQWHPEEPWTMLTVADDVSGDLCGGTMQMWRINDLIYGNQQEILSELTPHRHYIETGVDPSSKEGLVDLT